MLCLETSQVNGDSVKFSDYVSNAYALSGNATKVKKQSYKTGCTYTVCTRKKNIVNPCAVRKWQHRANNVKLLVCDNNIIVNNNIRPTTYYVIGLMCL